MMSQSAFETVAQRATSNPDVAIDRAHLARYTFGNRDVEAEILMLFADQSQSLFDQLRAAETATAWGFASHSLKGSARAVGAWRVAELAERLEGLSPHSDDAPVALAKLHGALVCAIRAATEADAAA